jgi:hypothetical protein
MEDAAEQRTEGDYCVVGFCDDWENGFGLQGDGYTKSYAEEVAKELDQDEEFEHVDEHEVMTQEEYRELCDEDGL